MKMYRDKKERRKRAMKRFIFKSVVLFLVMIIMIFFVGCAMKDVSDPRAVYQAAFIIAIVMLMALLGIACEEFK